MGLPGNPFREPPDLPEQVTLKRPEQFSNPPRIRLSVLVSTLTVGGAEQLLLELLRQIDNARFQPGVLFLKDPGIIGGEILQLGYPCRSGLIRSRFDLTGTLRVLNLLAAWKTDVLLLINHRDALFHGVLAAKLAGVPTVVNWANETNRTYSHHLLTMALRRLLHLGVDKVVAAAMGHQDYLSRSETIPSGKIVTIYNGVDPGRFASRLTREEARRRMGLGTEAPVVSIIAALRPDKAHHVFLRAAGIVLPAIPDAQFLIVGDGPERDRLIELSRELRIDSNVHFLGTRRDLGDILAATDVNTLSSNPEQETLSVAALEAMSAGVPMVATNVGFMREIVIPGKTGFLVTPGDPSDLSEKIVLLLRDDALRRNMGEESKRLVNERFSVTTMVAAFQDLFAGDENSSNAKRLPPRGIL
jgi:glycosyltransferase involved in cell wall biosynthesis